MVATGRKARSAKNRLSLSRVAVPVSLTCLPLPPGCAVTAKDVDELVHGESAQQQLCALKNIVAALGIVKDKQQADQSAPGLKEVVTAILEILPVQGSKALHDEIKVMLQGLPGSTCADVVEKMLLTLVDIKTWEMLLAVGVLCKVEAARPSLQKHVAPVLVAAGAALDALSASLRWSDAKSVRAQVDEVIGKGASKHAAPELAKDEQVGGCVVEPEMPAFVLNALMDVLATTSEQVAQAVGELVQGQSTVAAAAVESLARSLVGLLGNEAVQKDALTPCAIALCSLITRSHDKTEAIAAQLAVAAGCHATIDLDACAKLFAPGTRRPFISLARIQGCVQLDHDAFLPFARQALMRAVLSSGTQDVLMVPLAGKEGEEAASLMFSRIFDRIIAQCSATADLFFICYGLQSLAYAIDIAREALERILADPVTYAHVPRVPVSVVERMCSGGVKLLWPHCEDPFQGIVDQTKAMFDSLVSLGELAEKLREQETGQKQRVAAEDQHKELLELALAVKPNRKARYRVLVALVPRIGVKALLAKAPGLAMSVLHAMRDQSVGSGAGALLEVMMRSDPDASWWLNPVLRALTEGDTKLRYGLCNYALPTIAKLVPGGISALLLALQQLPDKQAGNEDEGSGQVSNLWAMTAVIKVARKHGTSGEAASQNCAQPLPPDATARVLRAALSHEDDEMRLNALEMVCLHPKMTEPPTTAELGMVQNFLSLNMKSSSSNYRQKCMEVLKRFFMRLRISRQHIETMRRKAERGVRNGKKEAFQMPQECLLKVVEEVDAFLAWLSQHLTAALFPGASFERNIMALELFVITIDVWQPGRARFPDPQIAEIKCSEEEEAMIRRIIFQPQAVRAVVNCVVNSFDYVRKQALEVLWRFPAPLPGLEERPALLRLLAWSESLINSPRARESDAGSLIVKIVYQKYVKELGWYLSPFPTSDATGEEDATAAAALAAQKAADAVPPTIFFLHKLIAGIDRRIDEAEANLEATFASSFAQGLLLTLRQVLPDVQMEMPSLLGTQRQQQQDERAISLWKAVLAQVLGRLGAIAAIAIRAMAGCPPERVGGDKKGERPMIVGGAAVSTGLFGSMYRKETQALASLPTPHSVQRDSLAATHRNTNPGVLAAAALEAHPRHTHVASLDALAQESAGGEEEDSDEAKLARLGPKEQLLVVSCWLTLKEVGLCVGTCIQGTSLDSDKYLSRTQIIVSGNLLLDIIFSTLHNGAIEKARLGFQKVCEKLLRCPRRDLRGLPAEWLERLLERLFAHDVPVVRRSSQLSFSVLAILDSEVANTHRALLERAMLFLLAVAKGQAPPPGPVLEGESQVQPADVKDAGVLLRAQVHALNILRHAFLDTNLAKELSSYIPEAMLCALDGFGAVSWAVRNSSTLCFSVLLSRSMGGAAQRKTFGSGEFFLRYPSLCPALVARLARAADALIGQGEMHPELQPVLVLLAQLAPSIHVRDDQAHLDAFVPLVRRCLCYQNAMVRMMAARSLHPFVPVQAVPSFVCSQLLGSLPARFALPAPRAFAHNNEVHGVLEAVRWLVKQNTVREDSWPDILESLTQRSAWHLLCQRIAAHLDWVLDQRLPPPIRLVLLRTASDLLWAPGGGLLHLPREQLGAAAELRDKTLAICIALLQTHENSASTQGPMLDALLAQASRLAARQHMLTAGTPDVPEQERREHLHAALVLTRRVRYEERYMALRAIKESVLGRLGLPPLSGPWRQELHEALLERLASETHAAGCERKLMRVLVELRQLPEGLEADKVHALWEQSKALIQARDPKVREKGLILSGEVVAAFLQRHARKGGSGTDAEALHKLLHGWLELVEEQADESRHVDERTAAVDALCRSTLLHLSHASLHALPEAAWQRVRGVVVRGWLLALLLLQDDDEDARCMMSHAVSGAVWREEGAEQGATAVQASKAIELVFHHLSRQELGAHDPVWHAFLRRMLANKSPLESGGGGATETCDSGEEGLSDEAMARRLFEKECDNFQAEELLIIQLSALHAQRLAAAPPLPSHASLPSLANDRAAYAADALSCLEAHLTLMKASDKGTSWAGGATSRLDVFLSTYRLVLACYAWGVGNAGAEMGGLPKLAGELEALEAHPLLLHAFELILEAAPSSCQPLLSREGLPLMWLTSQTA